MNEYKEIVVIHNDIKMQIKQIDSLKQAIFLFMKHEDEYVSCTDGVKSKVCNSLKECNDFFKYLYMTPSAKKIESAIYHFASTNYPVVCKSKYGSKTCFTLKQANDFFRNPPKKKRNKVRPIK